MLSSNCCSKCNCLQVLALPPPTAGPPPLPAAGSRPPPSFPSSTGGVGLGSVGRGVVNGGTSQPSLTDITAGALLIASVVQGD